MSKKRECFDISGRYVYKVDFLTHTFRHINIVLSRHSPVPRLFRQKQSEQRLIDIEVVPPQLFLFKETSFGQLI